MAKTLARTVHLVNPETNERVALEAGTELPEWASELVTNPQAFEPEGPVGTAASWDAETANAVSADADGYPADGTIEDVLAWVSADPARADVALERENARDKPRSTLVEQLEAITSG